MAAFGGAPSAASDSEAQEGESTATDFMTNTSTIDVTQTLPSSSISLPDSPSPYSPEFMEEVEAKAQQIVLEAGDILVMPPG